jgi:hypothetical protein
VDFEAGRNKAYGEALLKLQKRFVGLIAGKGAGIMRIPCFPGMGSLRWGTCIGSSSGFMPGSSAMVGSWTMATLGRVDGSHGYSTWSARNRLVVGSGDHRLVAYRVPAEWHTLTEEQRGMRSVGASSGAPRGTFWCSIGFFSVG